MKSSTGSRGSSRSVTNILNGAASVGTIDGLGSRSLSGSGPLSGTASLQNSKLSINSQGSHHSQGTQGSQGSQGSQKPIQADPADEEPTFLEKAKFYTSLCLGMCTCTWITSSSHRYPNLLICSTFQVPLRYCPCSRSSF